jgi:phage terminase small subunit
MAEQKSKDGLTRRQKLFASEFMKDRNAKAAAIRAGYSPVTAGNRGPALLKVPAVNAIVSRQTQRVAERAEVSAEFVIRELMSVASQEDVAQSTKVRALELLAKHLGMLEDKISLKTDGLSAEQRAERVAVLLERVRTR